jgi:hypothetical protein
VRVCVIVHVGKCGLCVCMNVCMCAYICVCTYISIYVCAYLGVCTFTHMCILHMCVYAHANDLLTTALRCFQTVHACTERRETTVFWAGLHRPLKHTTRGGAVPRRRGEDVRVHACVCVSGWVGGYVIVGGGGGGGGGNKCAVRAVRVLVCMFACM